MCHGVNVSGTPVEDSHIVMPSVLIKIVSVRGSGRRFEAFHLAEHCMFLIRKWHQSSRTFLFKFFLDVFKTSAITGGYFHIYLLLWCMPTAFKESMERSSYTFRTKCTFMSSLFWIIYWMIPPLGCHLFPYWYDIHKYVNKVKGKDI